MPASSRAAHAHRPRRCSRTTGRLAAALLWLTGVAVGALAGQGHLPGERSLLDAHNAYPYEGRWADRLQRALSTGLPVAIEQDLVYGIDAATGVPLLVVAHDTDLEHPAPPLVEHFFEAVRPSIEEELAQPRPSDWPLITLNLDIKGPAGGGEEDLHLLRFLRDSVLGPHQQWLTTSPRTADGQPAPLRIGPLLVLTGASDAQQRVFRDEIEVGEPILAFGAARDAGADEQDLPRPTPATDYRRWWNHPWRVVEPEGQRAAGEWTAADAERLRTLVVRAHEAGLWLRLYTLNGIGEEGSRQRGWFAGYDFGSLDAVRERWRACLVAGVDFVATDQYEGLAALRAASEHPAARRERRTPPDPRSEQR